MGMQVFNKSEIENDKKTPSISTYTVKYISDNFNISDVLDKSTEDSPYSFQMQTSYIYR